MCPPSPKPFQLWATTLTLAIAAALSSCSLRDAEVIEVTARGGKIDLGKQLPGHWERVCILLPYVTSGQAKKTLGFSYVPELHSGIYALDDRTLLVTIANGKAIGPYEVLRSNADFTQVGASCFLRSQAVFDFRETRNGWNEVSAT